VGNNTPGFFAEPRTGSPISASMEVKLPHIGNCLKADPAYGKGVADALGIALSAVRS
jgi:hypothetical protein